MANDAKNTSSARMFAWLLILMVVLVLLCVGAFVIFGNMGSASA